MKKNKRRPRKTASRAISPPAAKSRPPAPRQFDLQRRKVSLALWIMGVGMLIALVWAGVQGWGLGKDYPYNNFLFDPKSRFGDFTDNVRVASGSFIPYADPFAVYFPFAWVCLRVLSILPFSITITACLFVAVAGLFLLLVGSLEKIAFNPWARALAALAFLGLSYPLLFCIDRGNIELVLALLTTAAIYYFNQGKYKTGALCLLPAICFKFYPAFFLVLLVRRRKIALALGCLAAFLVITLLSLPILSLSIPTAWEAYHRNIAYFTHLYVYENYSLGSSGAPWNVYKALLVMAGDMGIISPIDFSYDGRFIGTSYVIYSVVMALVAGVVAIYACVVEKEFLRAAIALLLFSAMATPSGADYRLLYANVALVILVLLKTRRPKDMAALVLLALAMAPKKELFFSPSDQAQDAGSDIWLQVLLNPTFLAVALGLLLHDGWVRADLRWINLRAAGLIRTSLPLKRWESLPAPAAVSSGRQYSSRWCLAGVAGLLALYMLMAISAILQKSTTFDEMMHLTIGYLYWTQPANHLYPENGIIAQSWAALPLLFDHLQAPNEGGEPWSLFGPTGEYYQFFYSLGNNPFVLLFQGRTMISVIGAALGALVFFWSRQLFGIAGGFISLLLFVFCPTMLANGTLITADMAATLGFFAATYFFWKLSHFVSWQNLLLSILAFCGLFLAKMSATLMFPIIFLILVVRLCSGRPVEIHFFTSKVVTGFWSKSGWWALLLMFHALAIWAALWIAYDFPYNDWQQEQARQSVLSSRDFSFWNPVGLKAFLLERISQWKLLPAAYLEGLSYTLQAAEHRKAFLWGVDSETGWWWFFPFAFLIKTPVATLLLFLLAPLAFVVGKWFSRGWIKDDPARALFPNPYELAPLLILGGVYAVACLTTHLNIGHRHMMPIYPVLFVLAGANVLWLRARKPILKIAMVLLMMGTLTESLLAWPNYLAFFNQFVGGSRNGYYYLVDSSLDWGQDLPGLYQWLKKNVPDDSNTNVYLSYFGTGVPRFYEIKARLLPGFNLSSPQTFPLRGGVYCISATMLQAVYMRFQPPWNPDDQTLYEGLQGQWNLWIATANDPAGRARLLKEKPEDYWEKCVGVYGELRLARLFVYLRQRAPDDDVGHSILIYRLSDAEVDQALNAPLPQDQLIPPL